LDTEIHFQNKKGGGQAGETVFIYIGGEGEIYRGENVNGGEI